ncbi:signal peptidase I [Eubacterium oxidoreducens]|uniref:Signal peptidase I n=1 Tax=Eubacterium oxidoreducens TaxID=1732 RepID=A0A1G6C531_EUBOX|nr:signal peptidase I [Eubacterium oxidoreducens]SDB27878.1 signal peptidase I [Eubacterium oxidoreducens]
MIFQSRSAGPNFGRRKREINTELVKKVASWVVEIAIVVLIAFAIVYFVGMKSSVVGSSMSPTLEEGDNVLINRVIYKLSEPEANDIIVFMPNGNEKSHYYIKRVIAVPGDTVQIIDGTVYVNGEEFEEEIDAEEIENAQLAEEEIELGEDEYFVLGDNRNNSEDSRYANIGNVKAEYIVGKVWFCTAKGRFGFMN